MKSTSRYDAMQMDGNDQRAKFTRQLVDALKGLELGHAGRSEQSLANCAHNKLQFDFPLVSCDEIRALISVLKTSLTGKAAWPAFPLTRKLLDNISASCSSVKPPAAGVGAAPDPQPPALSAAAVAAGPQQQQNLQQLFQQLNALVVLLYPTRLLALPPQDAWPFVAGCWPTTPSSGSTEASQPQQQQTTDYDPEQQQLLAAALAEGLDIPDDDLAAAANTTTQPPHPTGPPCQEAATMDADGDVYEDLVPTTSSSRLTSTNSLATAWRRQQQQLQAMYAPPATINPVQLASSSTAGAHPPAAAAAFPGQPAYHQCLLSLLQQQCQYSLLSSDALWQQGCGQQVLELLRQLGTRLHEQQELAVGAAPLLVGLLVDRILAAPHDMPQLLLGCWESLGVVGPSSTGGAAAVAAVASQSSQQRGGSCLAMEQVLALNSVLALWQQLVGPSARAQLWQLLQLHLMPAVVACCEQMAYWKPAAGQPKAPAASTAAHTSGAAVSPAAGGCGASTTAALDPAAAALLSEVLLVAGVLEVYVLGRPQGVDVGTPAQQSGLLRSLCALFVAWGSQPAAEPLRRAALLLAASSESTAQWLLAVPPFKATLQQLFEQTAPPRWLQLYRAMWAVVCRWHGLPLPLPPTALPAGSGNGQQQQQQLVLLLESSLAALLEADVGELQQLQEFLQLMATVQQAAQAAGSSWSPAERQQLQQLHKCLKDMQQQHKQQQPQQQQPGDIAGCSSDGDDERPQAGSKQQGSNVAAQQLQDGLGREWRRGSSTSAVQLLWPTLHQLIKQLLHEGPGGSKRD